MTELLSLKAVAVHRGASKFFWGSVMWMSCILESVHLQSPCAIESKKNKQHRRVHLYVPETESSSPCISKHRVFDFIPIVSLSLFLESRIWFKLNEEIIFQFEALSLTVCRRLQFLDDIGE